MEIIEIKTLVDITKPNVQRPGQGSALEQSQYKNWITFQQCLGLRSIISFDELPFVEEVEIKDSGFGTKHKGKHKVWSFTFYPDRSFAYQDDEGKIAGLLYQDLHQVPVIEKLTETINMHTAVFDVEDVQYKNTIIKSLKREE